MDFLWLEDFPNQAGEEMSGETVPSVQEIGAITDPGEVDRDQQTWADRFVIQIANAFAWAFPFLIFCIVSQVVLRYSGFNQAWLDLSLIHI